MSTFNIIRMIVLNESTCYHGQQFLQVKKGSLPNQTWDNQSNQHVAQHHI